MKAFLCRAGAQIPAVSTERSAGYDLFAAASGTIAVGDHALIPTGVKIELEPFTCGLVCSRSGMALKNGVIVLNAPGVIDEDYRGEVGVILKNLGSMPYHFAQGDRIAQLLVIQLNTLALTEVSGLDTTARGAAGFGSTGV